VVPTTCGCFSTYENKKKIDFIIAKMAYNIFLFIFNKMDIVGVVHDISNVIFVKKETRISTHITYIAELFNIFRENGISDIGFSYNLNKERGIIEGVWTPTNLKTTMCGFIFKYADDYLKKMIIELNPIFFGQMEN
jgi:hypothetical protein